MADEIDPCAEAARLRQIRTDIATGKTVSRASFGEDETQFFKADQALLEREITRFDKACALKEGRAVKRSRYAIRGVARPY